MGLYSTLHKWGSLQANSPNKLHSQEHGNEAVQSISCLDDIHEHSNVFVVCCDRGYSTTLRNRWSLNKENALLTIEL